MTLADRIIQHGPYFGGDPSPFTNLDYAELNRLRDELIAGRRGTTYEEWRVTGRWDGTDMEFEFSPARGITDPESAARAVAAQVPSRGRGWTDGPHLHKRTVTVTDWTEVDA